MAANETIDNPPNNPSIPSIILKALIIAIVANTVIINPIEPSVNWNGPRIWPK